MFWLRPKPHADTVSSPVAASVSVLLLATSVARPHRGGTNRSRRSPVVVMKPAEHGERDDLPVTGRRGPSHRGQGALTQALMRADAIEIANVLRQSREEVALVQDDHVVQAFAPHALPQCFQCRAGLACTHVDIFEFGR